MRLKAKTKFQSKAGEFNEGDSVKTDRTHGQFLVDAGYAEEVAKEEEKVEGVTDKQVSKKVVNNQGHK